MSKQPLEQQKDPHLTSHEALCALRYAGIEQALERLEGQIDKLFERWWVVAGSVIGGLITVITILFTMLGGK